MAVRTLINMSSCYEAVLSGPADGTIKSPWPPNSDQFFQAGFFGSKPFLPVQKGNCGHFHGRASRCLTWRSCTEYKHLLTIVNKSCIIWKRKRITDIDKLYIYTGTTSSWRWLLEPLLKFSFSRSFSIFIVLADPLY
jgi:hypothetical protein